MESILLLLVFVCLSECRKSWREFSDSCLTTNLPNSIFRATTSRRPSGLALDGQLASRNYSFLIAYHYKNSGKLMCSGIILNSYWTISVPNCFYIPAIYYRKAKDMEVQHNETLNEEEFSELIRDVVSIPPSMIVVRTIFDGMYKPCTTSDEVLRVGKRVITPDHYSAPFHTAEIALVQVSVPFDKLLFITLPPFAAPPLSPARSVRCQALGFGALKLNRTALYRPMLSIIEVEVFEAQMCKIISRTYNKTILAEDLSYVCSYNTKYSYGSPLSQGDSGGALICEGSLVGVVQWIHSKDPGHLQLGPSQDTPQLYTRLDVFMGWVLSIIDRHQTQYTQALLSSSSPSSLFNIYSLLIVLLTFLF